VNLKGMGSLDAAQAILDGKEKPTIFSPGDSLVLKMLESDWETKNHTALFPTEGPLAPQPLVITPLVFAVWADRAAVLEKAGGGAITWASLEKAVGSDRGWPAIGGKADWGFVKLGHTDPTRSNSGLQSLLLMALEYHGKSAGLAVQDVLDPGFQAWLKNLEKGNTRFETSTGTFMTDMIRFGPSKYDIAVVYESLAIANLANAQGRWGDLKVYYPPMTSWSDHPAGVLQAEWVTDAQKNAARTWLEFLRSPEIQKRALDFGFRPADPSIPIKSESASNPWVKFAQYGVKVDVPTAVTAPDGAVIRNLLTMWSRVIATH
jgi:Bacterial extracellular solute-binding protein